MRHETELRQWLTDSLSPKTNIQWVEPGRYGSTMGAADCILKQKATSVYLELKVWEEKRRGIKCEMRPIQRRWHRVTYRHNSRCAVLVNLKGTDINFLIRGDHVPLRDYSSDPESGCKNGVLIFTYVMSFDVEDILFDDGYAFWSDEQQQQPAQ
jgi:hypothetical protein